MMEQTLNNRPHGHSLRSARCISAATADVSISRFHQFEPRVEGWCVYDEQALADNKLAALIDDQRTAPRDIYDLELLLARGIVPSVAAVENLGGRATLIQRIADKLDLMSWALFRDEVLPTLPVEIHAHIDEDEYLAMKVRLVETLERSLAKNAGDAGSS